MGNQQASKIRFNVGNLKALTCPAGKSRAYFYDTLTPGLAVCVTAAGSKSFYWYRWHRGRPVRALLGKLETMTVEQARTLAVARHAAANEGVDPKSERREQQAEKTLLEAFELFKSAPSRRTKSPRSAKTIEGYDNQWDNHLKPWANRRLSEISREAVSELHQKIGKTATYQANRVLALLSAIYGIAPRHGYKGQNPAKDIERFRERANMRYLRADELKAFSRALNDEPNQTLADAIRMALFTGARRSNVQAMAWREIDMKAAVWHIPQQKGGDKLDIPLPPQAVAVLARRQKARVTGCPWVFPSKRAAGGHVVELKSAMTRIIEAAGIPKLRVHDLRHTLASFIVNSGASLPTVARQLGHKTLSTTAKYAHTDISTARAGVNAAVNAMSDLAVDKL